MRSSYAIGRSGEGSVWYLARGDPICPHLIWHWIHKDIHGVTVFAWAHRSGRVAADRVEVLSRKEQPADNARDRNSTGRTSTDILSEYPELGCVSLIRKER